jgi:hypothetical protein
MRFGVQALPGEADLHVAEAVVRKAYELGVQFKRLDVFEPVSIGTHRFFRMDAGSTVDLTPVLDALFIGGRGVIGVGGDAFIIRLGTRTGPIASTTMQVTQKPPRVYRGTLDPFWQRQFTKA